MLPELFPDLTSYILCALVMAGAQLLYATVGFGAGMFTVALLAMVLPDLAGTVAVLLVLTVVTEVCVLARTWRQGRIWLLLGFVPTMALGLWLGTQVLAAGDVGILKRLLGVFVALAGVWFFIEQTRRRNHPDPPNTPIRNRWHGWICLPIGLISGVLGGMFGTGGPPIIIYLRTYRLDKGAFRATLLWYFLLMSIFRTGTYVQAGLLTQDVILAAMWLLPASLVGIVTGMALHRRMTEHHFGNLISLLLVILGVLLLIGVGK